jgi:hypothetical protein
MGFNSTVVILNDALNAIREDKDFGHKVYDAVCAVQLGKTVDISSGHHVNAATVVESHHADGYRLVLVGGNTAYVLGYAGHWSKDPKKTEDLQTILNNVVEEYGLKVIKARKPK